MRIRIISAALVATLGLGIALAVPASGQEQQQDNAARPAPVKFPGSFYFTPRPPEYIAMEGKPAPELALTDFIKVEGFTNDDLKGKITVVDIWATWCGPCIAAIPKNNEIAAKYADQGVVVLGVCSSSRGQETYAQAVQKHNIQYPTAKDPELKTQKAWNVKFYPTYAIVDREGVVRGIGLKPGNLEDAIKMLLKEQPATNDGGEAQVAGGEAAE